jgi:hypothetical protein
MMQELVLLTVYTSHKESLVIWKIKYYIHRFLYGCCDILPLDSYIAQTNDVKMNVLLDQSQNDMLVVAVAHVV